MGILIIIALIAIIVVAVMTMSNTVDTTEESKGSDFDIDPKIGDFGMDPADVESTPVAQKPKKKYKRKPKNKKMIE